MACGSFRAVVRVISGFSRLLRAAVWPPGDAGHSGHFSRPCWYSLGSGATLRSCRSTVPGSARGMQRFLTDSPWDDEVIIGRLQEYLGTRLEHPEGVWVLDGSDFPNAGEEVWEWPGSTAGGWGRWPTARRGCSWPSARWDGHWWTSGCICRGLDLGQRPV